MKELRGNSAKCYMGEMHAIYNLRKTNDVISKIRISCSLFVSEFCFVYIQFYCTGYDIGIRAYQKLCQMASEKENIEPPVVL